MELIMSRVRLKHGAVHIHFDHARNAQETSGISSTRWPTTNASTILLGWPALGWAGLGCAGQA